MKLAGNCWTFGDELYVDGLRNKTRSREACTHGNVTMASGERVGKRERNVDPFQKGVAEELMSLLPSVVEKDSGSGESRERHFRSSSGAGHFFRQCGGRFFLRHARKFPVEGAHTKNLWDCVREGMALTLKYYQSEIYEVGYHGKLSLDTGKKSQKHRTVPS
jgi:hypothetical protein